MSQSTASASFSPVAPDLGASRRVVAAILAVMLVTVAANGWSHTDVPPAAGQTQVM